MLYAKTYVFLIWLFFCQDGLMVFCEKPVTHLHIYHGDVHHIDLRQVNFVQPVQSLVIPYKSGKNILVVKYHGKMTSLLYE